MLEELSLNSNKGSKMFKKRQQRVEKFIVTNENKVRAGECVSFLHMSLLIRLFRPSFLLQQNFQNLLTCPPPVAPKPEKAKEEGGVADFDLLCV